MPALGPLLSGFLLERFTWGSVFLVTIPLALVALYMARRHVPAHVHEATEPVDNLGGVLSAVMIGALVIGLNFITVPRHAGAGLGLFAVAAVMLVLFVLRQRRVRNPLYDLKVASRRTFWVAAMAGIIVFGSLMGVAFINQQYLQNVLGYTTLQAGAAILPAVVFMVLVAPRSAKLVQELGSRATLLLGQAFLAAAFVGMLLLWGETTRTGWWPSRSALMGIGVGLAGTPSSNSLTGSVPVAPRGHGIWHGRPSARPWRRPDDLDIRRAADRRLRGRNGRGHRRVRPGRHGGDAKPAPTLIRQRGGPGGQ